MKQSFKHISHIKCLVSYIALYILLKNLDNGIKNMIINTFRLIVDGDFINYFYGDENQHTYNQTFKDKS